MKNVWNSLLILISMNVSAQNLVPNPSFEDTVSCPDNYGQIENAMGWSSYRYSPDYLNSCSQTNVGVPNNLFGYQQAKIGVAYAGISTYGMNGIDTVREYIGVQLLQPLIIGTKYFLSCYVSRGDMYYSDGASNNFGFRFSTVPYNYLTNPFKIDNISHFHYDSIITDSINWVRISGTFISDSTYQYLILGNFYDNSHTDTADINDYFAYYFVDAICVTTDSVYNSSWVGLNEFTASHQINIFPNPVTDKICLKGIRESVQFRIINLTGQTIKEGVLNKENNVIGMSSFVKGIYILIIENDYYKIIVNN